MMNCSRSNVTIFSVPKAFSGHIGIIQRNAVSSWLSLSPRPEIILIGNDEGVQEFAREFGLAHVSEIDRNECGTPLLSSAFAIARAQAQRSTLCYVNADIILMPEFMRAVRRSWFRKYLVIGRRTDLAVNDLIDFSNPDWHISLRDRARRDGRLFTHWGMDYFVFPRDQWPHVPPFAVGRSMWDNWLVFDARSRGIPVIDATRAALALHQDHAVNRRLLLANGEWDFSQPEVRQNVVLGGGLQRACNAYDSNWVMTRWAPLPALELPYLYRRASHPPRTGAAAARATSANGYLTCTALRRWPARRPPHVPEQPSIKKRFGQEEIRERRAGSRLGGSVRSYLLECRFRTV